ncbi:MAG: hypothetical protein GX376_02550 [Firmicutes bacterium]|nr:hypothetical protein [Bacillota bacterium]
MLKKLLKYDLQATLRIFLPLYAILISVAVINKLISIILPLQVQAPKIMAMIIYITIMVGMFVITFIMMLQRFYKNLLSEEGYLMFTLPTQPWKLIASKLLVAILWTAASALAAYISIFIIVFQRGNFGAFIIALKETATSLYAFLGPSMFLFIIEVLLGGVLSLAAGILLVYASMALGHLCNRHRILASVGAFIALNALTQILFFQLVRLIAAPLSRNMQALLSKAGGYLSTLNGVQLFHGVMWFGLAATGILAAGYFAITNYVLSRRLNLE